MPCLPPTTACTAMKPRWIAYSIVLILICGLAFAIFREGPRNLAGGTFSEEYRNRRSFKGAPEEIRKFLRLDSLLDSTYEDGIVEIRKHWKPEHRYQLLDMFRYLRKPYRREEVAQLLAEKTGQDFGTDYLQWRQWSWNEEFEPGADYAKFKSCLYSRMDGAFEPFFEQTDTAKIRLDEIQWGGVTRDGIPPLKDPEMISAADADYLDDSNIVFGVEINGDARCYPKRILAWHEMFKDTIGNISVAGVY